MRITSKMLSDNYLNQMRKNLENMQTLQTQLSTGKQVSRPSDDPFKVTRTMELYDDIDQNTQYNENIGDALNWLSTTDTALNQAGDVMQRMRQLLVSAGNGAYGTEERQSIKDEINQNISQISQILNTNFDGKYLFGGSSSNSKSTTVVKDANGNNEIAYNIASKTDSTKIAVPDNPSDLSNLGNITLVDPNNPSGATVIHPADTSYAAEKSNYVSEANKISTELQMEISQGVTLQYNSTATDIMNYGNRSSDGKTDSLTQLFQRIVSHLDDKNVDGTPDSNAQADLTGNDLKDMTSAIDNLLTKRSIVGAKENAMTSAKSKNEDQNYNFTDLLSKTEDIDITEKTMDYSVLQTVYTASLQVSAKILPETLLDYLR